jgi:ABC-type nickel/cobalt efflux system permease component RcnA
MLKDILGLLEAIVQFLVTIVTMGAVVFMLAALIRLGLGWWQPSTEQAVRIILTLALITALNTIWLPRQMRDLKELRDENNLYRATELLRQMRSE